MKNRVLIFGTGFLAHHLIERLSALNYEIYVLYNNHLPELQYITDGKKLDDISVDDFMQETQPNYVFLLHGDSFIPDNSDYEKAIKNNVLLHANILSSIEKSSSRDAVKKIIIIGSASEYGSKYVDAIDETFELEPTTLYGLSKTILYETSMFFQRKGLPIVYVRQFNAIGPHQRNSFVLPSLCMQVAKLEKSASTKRIELGELSHERDFIDVRDAVEAYLLLLEKGASGEVYNVASGTKCSVAGLLEKVLETTSIKDEIEIVSKQGPLYNDRGFSKTLLASIDKLKALGFATRYTLDDTVRDTLEYWRKNV